MATKWKDMIKTNKKTFWDGICNFFKQYVKMFCSIVLVIAGIAFFYNLIAYRQEHPTEEALFFGLVGNILFGFGWEYILHTFLQKKYGELASDNDSFYVEWGKNWKEQQRIITTTGVVFLILACWYFSYQSFSSLHSWGYTNYASGYIMIFTVLIQYGISRHVTVRFMKKRLDDFMRHMAEMNRQRIAEALEIERRSLEKVSRSDQLKVDLITNVSHDLKTPLTSMVGYIELMKKEDLNDTVKDYVEVISDKADKLKEMVESLFSLAKVSSGNIEFHMETMELNRLIEQLFADMEDRIKESNLEFVKQLAKEDTAMVTDNMYLYRICQNLVENALKYSAKGTRVFVKTYLLEEEKLCLEITNTAGYRMDFDKESIVERFARGDEARTGDGNGLGLAIVSTYTSALGGEFDIQIDCDQFKAKLIFPVKGMIEEKE